MTTVPPPAPENFDEAAAIFNSRKPAGTRIAGIAIVIGAQILWSVNYEVDDDRFPVPKRENRDKARSKFQSSQPTNAAVVQVSMCQIKPGGLVLSKWQVTYAVKMEAAATPPLPITKHDSRPRRNATEVYGTNKTTDPQTKNDHQDRIPNLFHEVQQRTMEWCKKETAARNALRSRLLDFFVTKTNVQRVTSREARTWMSKGKSNVVHALKRIAAKATRTEKPQPKTRPNIPTVRFESAGFTTPQEVKPPSTKMNQTDPANIYKAIERNALITKIKDAKSDKLAVLSSLLHVASCKKGDRPSQQCVRSAYWLQTYNILRREIPTTNELTGICRSFDLQAEKVLTMSISPRMDPYDQTAFYRTGISMC